MGGGGECGDAFDGVDVAGGADEVGEDGGLVAGAGAEFEDAVAGAWGELLGHGGDDVGLGDGLAVGGGESFVGVGLGLEFVGDEKVAGDLCHGVEDGGEDDAAAAEVVVEHVLAGGGVGVHGKLKTQNSKPSEGTDCYHRDTEAQRVHRDGGSIIGVGEGKARMTKHE
jgi:hypothetical protein